MSYFRSADILLPANCDYSKWAVIACDQYTSQPEYWQNVRAIVEDAPSTIHMFFPESDLNSVSKESYDGYCANMVRYLNDGLLKEYTDSYVYVERTLCNGAIRQGVVGVIDLEYYDYAPKPETKIFATEATVLQRVPPRVTLRKQASLEFSHTVMFCDDPSCTIVESVAAKSDQLPILYDFDLMCDGGHIRGYLLQGDNARQFEQLIAAYEAENTYLVGDGNHSLVTAKLCYQALKEANPEKDFSNHPARYAMVELENIHSPAMLFEPIYRIVVCQDPQRFIQDLTELDSQDGLPVTCIIGQREGTVKLAVKEGELLAESLQRFLDHWIDTNPGSVDYIHGADSVRELAKNPGTVGLLVPDLDKSVLFPYVLSGKVMPKKTFSIGHASEKRYYLEGRKII